MIWFLGRFLQFIGLTLPLSAIVLQLGEWISAGTMLTMTVASVCVFYMGYIVAGYGSNESGGASKSPRAKSRRSRRRVN